MRKTNKSLAYVLFALLLLNPVVSPLVAAFSYYSASNAVVKQLYKNNKKRKNKVFNVSKSDKGAEKQEEKKHKNPELAFSSFTYTPIVIAANLKTAGSHLSQSYGTSKLFILQRKLIL